MRVGIDAGTTLTKFAYLSGNGNYTFETARDAFEVKRTIAKLLSVGITAANIIGIGNREALLGLKLIRKPGDPIDNELRIQADGARRALGLVFKSVNPRGCEDLEFFLVSIGTGTSYVISRKEGIEKLPFGRALGGGTIVGLAAAMNILGPGGLAELEEKAETGKPLDIFVSDLVPASEIDPADPNLIVSNFAKADGDSSPGDLAASIFHLVAVNIIEDVALMGTGKLKSPQYVVYIGSTVATVNPLVKYLDKYSRLVGFEALFPLQYAPYAGALGALHMND